ncbi:ATP-binding protein [Pseudomonas tructae]|uniref:ATP-binding protein n=1 Tax=Pseudomonas tructae TaxID=2518644 RepID=A0A411MLH5_9PSED|nr:AAA family ATPase [Pseudomonas tructae]QBF27622.1 ATP-binding protein [Pseudomonas tructae]
MKLSFYRPYKSIQIFEDVELPDFTVITGANGSGKSHLLKAIQEEHIKIDGFDHLPQGANIIWHDATTLAPIDNPCPPSSQIVQEREQHWNSLSMLLYGPTANLKMITYRWPKLSKLEIEKLYKLEALQLLDYGVATDEAEKLHEQIQNTLKNEQLRIVNSFTQLNHPANSILIQHILSKFDKPIFTIDRKTFIDLYPIDWQPVNLFQQSFSRVCSEYQSTLITNEFNAYRRDFRGATTNALTPTEFINKHGSPPWEIINHIFEIADIKFRISPPDDSIDFVYQAMLTDTITNAKISFSDLSSGEKILMSFALCLYNTSKPESHIANLPKILLFDEIDAPLHPSMTKSLLDIIQKVFINEQKIKVIMTTHSPSTVALCPEESIFTMKKEGTKRLRKTNKDKALSLLMSGVPSLSLSYENRRQVFVESHLDVKYYDQILRKLKPMIHPAISLSFIASGKTKKGGCELVKDIVSQLSKNGNPTIRGLIDWDRKNQSTDNIVVLGSNKRYAIENYLLDPLLIAILLFQDKAIDRQDIGLEEHEGSAEILAMPPERLQRIADHIINIINPATLNTDRIKCEYISNQFIFVPRVMLEMQGHDLEDLLPEKIPALRGYKNNKGIKETVLKRVIDEHPSFIPKCFLHAFLSLQKPITG